MDVGYCKKISEERGRKAMWFRKRIFAGILAVVVAVSSMQLPAGVVYAEEAAVVSDEKGMHAETEPDGSGTEETEAAGGHEPGKADNADNGADRSEEESDSEEQAEPEEEDGQSEGKDDSPESGEQQPDEDRQEEPDGSGTPEADEEQPAESDNDSDKPEEPEENNDGDGSEITDGSQEEDGKQDGSPDGTEEPDTDDQQVSGNDISESVPAEAVQEEDGERNIAAVSGEGLNLANPIGEYTALDGSTISSTAMGKPKMLIFYSNTCGNCQRTIRGISQNIEDFWGVDIHALETTKVSMEDVADFRRRFGCEEILFSYDTGGNNGSSMWDYAFAAGISNGIAWPLIAYIDADNRLQYVTTAYKTVDEVLADLKQYCDFPNENEERFKITYVLNGGTNSRENPAFYTSQTDTIILQDAARAGHPFEGWYKDPRYSVRVREIARGSTGNITLYAKWGAAAEAEIPKIDITPSEDGIVMGFSGSYYTESVDKILNRLNDIRWEACKQGVRNPLTGNPLTEADYVPLQWSSDLEAIARLRAAEATVNQGHTRPNGQSCFSISTSNGESSYGENLAWNYSGLMAGIEQWYKEKQDWVNQTAGAVTGHYTSMISPGFCSVGVGAFRLSSGGWYAVAQQFSYKDTLNAYKNPDQGKCVQDIEVEGSNVTGFQFDKDIATFLREGSVYRIPLNISVKYNDYYGSAKTYSGPYQAGGTWYSSDEAVAAVDSKGMLRAGTKGTADISIKAGKKEAAVTVTVYGRDESLFTIQSPDTTTYKVGEKLKTAGGKVTYEPVPGKGTVTTDMKPDMVSGFDSSKPGICTVSVSFGGYVADFDALIVEEPEMQAAYGQRLDEIALPSCEYGTYSWQDGTQVLDQAGVRTYAAEFTPADQEKFQKLTDIQVKVTTRMMLGSGTEITFKRNTFIYNGTQQEPKAVVAAADNVLTEGQDYVLSYEDNKNAGLATVTVQGINYYHGSVRKTFEIKPAPAVIKARDMTILIGGEIPAYNGYSYEVRGLMKGDRLVEPPIFSCRIISTEETGCYDIIPGGADAGPNYTISYEKGKLVVASEFVSGSVTFDVQGHGTAPADQVGIKIGGTARKPADPSAAGYRFDGWYSDAGCTKAWNFDTDIVQGDVTLYAKWLYESEPGGFAMQEIADVYYTGKACKPAVTVYDGETLLRAGRDYQIRYYNNVNANKDNLRKQGNGGGAFFKEELPYVEITGKGNYTEKVRVNFNILPVLIGDDSGKPADGVTLKLSDQLVKTMKAQKPFSSIKCGRTMRKGTDYTVSLSVENGRDQSGKNLPMGTALEDAVIPAGYEGEFLLTIRGLGNYEGSISRSIYVADKAHLMKNARITFGRNLKDISFNGEPIELRTAEYDSPDVLTVKYGGKFLRCDRDYTVSYRNNDRVGKAELIITGIGEYVGEKKTTFEIRGKSFKSGTVQIDGIEDKVYTGTALTQNDAFVLYGKGTEGEKALVYGTDYTISYAKNVNAGTAVMTFTGIEQAGYSGSFKKSFRIKAEDITQTEQAPGMENVIVSYSKAGAMPAEKIVLTNKAGIRLVNGKDYTLRYRNNKMVADRTAEEPPTVLVKGKGNYTGELPVSFSIVRKDLTEDDITIRTSAAAYKENKEDSYAYKPSVKLMDGKKQLRAGVDYEIAYENNTQAAYKAYLQSLEGSGRNTSAFGEAMEQGAGVPGRPQAVITQKEGSNYTLQEPLIVPLTIYRDKLTKSNLTVEIKESVYTGTTVRPAVTVYYQNKDGGSRILLVEGEDYSLTYGSNIVSGRNKGSVKISGIGPYYGGEVTVRFDIGRKAISYQ